MNFCLPDAKKRSTRELGDWKILLPRDVLETGAVVVLHLQHLLWDALVHVTENLSQRASNEGRLSGRFQRHCVARGRHYCCHRLPQFRNLHGLRCEQDLATSSVGCGFHPCRLPWHQSSVKGRWQGHWGERRSSTADRWWWWWWWCNGASGDCGGACNRYYNSFHHATKAAEILLLLSDLSLGNTFRKSRECCWKLGAEDYSLGYTRPAPHMQRKKKTLAQQQKVVQRPCKKGKCSPLL